MSFLGSSLSVEDISKTKDLEHLPREKIVTAVQEILDPYCLAMLEINDDSRIKVLRGPAKARLMQDGWTSVLVKVRNEAVKSARSFQRYWITLERDDGCMG